MCFVCVVYVYGGFGFLGLFRFECISVYEVRVCCGLLCWRLGEGEELD